ncbi:MAG: recombinase family protein [Gammaproteobacteria bacterium]
MNVALYARVSTKNQQKHGTIDSQIEALRNYAKAQDVAIAEDDVCKDEGYSGALLARPGLDRLRDGAQAGAFDALLVLSPDRLSRKYAYLILILEEFERYGVRVIVSEATPGGGPTYRPTGADPRGRGGIRAHQDGRALSTREVVPGASG